MTAATLTGLAATQSVTAQTVTTASTAAACGPTWTGTATAPDAVGQTSELLAVTRIPGGPAWAVGDTKPGGIALIEEQTPSGWVRVPSHAPGGSTLEGVAAYSASDIWAVGALGSQIGPTGTVIPAGTLIEHWNGSAWTVVKGPDVRGGLLDAVTVLSPDDAWAVGSSGTMAFPVHNTLIEHWNGTAWSVVPNPDHPHYVENQLTAIAASSPSSIWAVGNSNPSALAEYWDGTDWRLITVADGPQVTLNSLALISRTDAWAAGQLRSNGVQGEHWNGSAWQTFSLGPESNVIIVTGMAAAGPRDIWAVGPPAGFNPQFAPQNFNGATWRPASLAPLPGASWANAVTILPGGGALAVGATGPITTGQRVMHGEAWAVCPAQVTPAAFAPAAVTDPDWLTVYWRSAGRTALALRDGSGLGLIRSAPLPPGATYSYRFYAAGTFPVTEASGSARQEVSVPLHVLPAATGTTGTRFLLTWAARAAPYGYVYDIQVKAPGQASFVPFRTNVSYTDAKFTPTQAGTYEFEARLRKYATGAHSGWSPPLSVAVTG
jgi:hypothetical protein